jgi:hypothetical protein
LDSNQQKKIGFDYLSAFYINLQNLKQQRCYYANILAEIAMTGKKDDIKIAELSDEQKNALVNAIQNVRYFMNLVNMSSRVILEQLNLDYPTLKVHYTKASTGTDKSAFVLVDADIEEYIYQVDKTVFTSSIQEILSSAHETIGKIYDEPSTTN